MTNDLWKFHVDSESLTKIEGTTGEKPQVRSGHGSTVIDGDLYIFGGYNKDGYLNNLYRINPEQLNWVNIPT